ncbi:MAG: glycosyltransferase, partial [Candidatus Omnitrophica bacterium]|nr:glycosyltransferase [Candidatus Omnitrophota bacterium]
MLKNLTFAVAVSTFNRNEDLNKCLESLSKQSFKDFEVVIGNGGDPKGVEEVVAKFNNLKIKVANQERKGIVEGRSLGWRNAQADIVCFIDDDLVVSPDWLREVRETFLSDEKIGGVSGPTIIPQDRLKNRDMSLFLAFPDEIKNIFLRFIVKIYLCLVLENKVKVVGRILPSGAFTPGSNFIECTKLPAPVDVDYLEACHMCFYRSFFEKTGGFDYAYTGTGEWNEPDFSFKVRRLGYRLVFNPKAVTEHHISQGGVFKARTFAYERSRNFIYF